MPQIGSKGANLDLLIRQGATFGPIVVTLTNPDTSPMDITSCVFRAQIRKTPSSTTTPGGSATTAIVSALAGQFSYEFPSALTTALTADSTSEESAASQYVWDLEMDDAAGRTIPLLYGVVKVFREVTKVDP